MCIIGKASWISPKNEKYRGGNILSMVRCKTIDWNEVLKKVRTQPWAAALIEALKQDFEEHISLWPKDPPLEQSAWGHYYFCSDCGTRLKFDVREPHVHVCPICGKAYTGWPYDGAWRKIMHSAIVSNLERAAILAHVNDGDKYKRYIHDTILFYANNYDRYPVHGEHAGKGKVYPQVLTEAIFVIAIERILRMSADLNIFSQAEYDAIGELFFIPALQLIKPQIGAIHNIHAWMQAAVAACAGYLNDMNLLKQAIYGEYGWLDQITKGTTREGIWYEVSSSYHYYTLNALVSFAWVALENGINLFENPLLKKMASSYIPLTYPDGKFPAFNDCWFDSNIFQACSVYEQLTNWDRSFEALLAWIYRNMAPRPYEYLNALFNGGTRLTGYARASLAALLYGPVNLPEVREPGKESFLYPDTGIAVLQNDRVRVTVKFSGNGGGHDHNDKISIELYAYDQLLSYDVGTTGYGIAFTRDWSRTSIAHNLVCIDGRRQNHSQRADVLSYDGNSISVQAEGAYEGVCLKREISLQESGFEDIFTVKCDRISQIDWIFHCRGRVETDVFLSDRNAFTQGNGYNQLFDLKHAILDEDFSVTFVYKGLRVQMHFKGEKNTEVIVGRCYGSNSNDILSFIMLRRYAEETEFKQQTCIVKN